MIDINDEDETFIECAECENFLWRSDIYDGMCESCWETYI